MSTTKLRGGLGGETVIVTAVEDAKKGPRPEAKPSRIKPTPLPREVDTLRTDDECEGADEERTLGRAGKLGPVTAADLLLCYTDYLKGVADDEAPMTPLAWAKDRGVVATRDVIVEFEKLATVGVADTGEHAALPTVEIPTPAVIMAEAGAVRVAECPPPGFVDPLTAATRAVIRARVRRIAIACVLLAPALVFFGSMLVTATMTAIYITVGVAAALVFVGPGIKDAIEGGLYRFVTVKVWVELGAAMAIVGGIGLTLYTGHIVAWSVIMSLAVVTLLIKHSILAVRIAQAENKMPAVMEIREEIPVSVPPAA